MRENRRGTMTCDELPFNGEAARSPHPSRRWSFVVDAAGGAAKRYRSIGIPPQQAESDCRRNPGTRPGLTVVTIQSGEK
jgi:hypothetical protein